MGVGLLAGVGKFGLAAVIRVVAGITKANEFLD
jgi:hypothetical protein